jgi:hypothetical protein
MNTLLIAAFAWAVASIPVGIAAGSAFRKMGTDDDALGEALAAYALAARRSTQAGIGAAVGPDFAAVGSASRATTGEAAPADNRSSVAAGRRTARRRAGAGRSARGLSTARHGAAGGIC